MEVWFWFIVSLVVLFLIGEKIYFLKLRKELSLSAGDIIRDFYSGRFYSCADYGDLVEKRLYRFDRVFSIFVIACFLLTVPAFSFVLAFFSFREDVVSFFITIMLLLWILVLHDRSNFFKLCRAAHQEIFKLTAQLYDIPIRDYFDRSDWNAHSSILPIHLFDRFNPKDQALIARIVRNVYHAYAETWMLPEDWRELRSDSYSRFGGFNLCHRLLFFIEHCHKLPANPFLAESVSFYYKGKLFYILRDLRNRDIILKKQGTPTRIVHTDKCEIFNDKCDVLIYEIPVWKKSWPRLPDVEKPDHGKPYIIRHSFYIYSDDICKHWTIERVKDGYTELIHKA